MSVDSQANGNGQPEMPRELTTNWAQGLTRRLANGWRGTLLTMDSDSQNMTDPKMADFPREIASAVEGAMRDGGVEDEETVLRKVEAIITAFLPRSVVANIDKKGFIDIVTLAVRECTKPGTLENTELRIGFGAAPAELQNARLPSYIIAAVSILRDLAATRSDGDGSRGLPSVRLYSAASFIGSINGGGADKTVAAAARNFALIKKYLEAFVSSEIASRFVFDEDRAVEKSDPLSTLIGYYAKVLLRAQEPESMKARAAVLRMGDKYESSPENALGYAAVHTSYAADAIPGPFESILVDAKERPRNLVMIGGDPEKTFWRVRETVRRGVSIAGGIEYCRSRLTQLNCPLERGGCEELQRRFAACTDDGTGYMRAQLISQAGKMPVYGAYKGDWSVRDVAEKGFDELMATDFEIRMKRDLLAVLCDIAGEPVEKAYALTDKKPLDGETRTNLGVAYELYADFCRSFLEENPSPLEV